MRNIILQICGTSGSGKSTLMRSIMREGATTPRFTFGRKTPIGYDVKMKGAAPLFVLGSYENVAGGCDTIKTMDEVYDRVKREWGKGNSVAFEGLLASKNFGRGLELFRMAGDRMTIVLLTTSLEECYASIARRREAAGKPPRDGLPKATENDKKGHDQYAQKMRQIDARVHRVSREEALAVALTALREK